jgi:hypothetical protein
VFRHAKVLCFFTIRGLCHNDLPARFRNEYPVSELVAGKNGTVLFISLFIQFDSCFFLGEGVL